MLVEVLQHILEVEELALGLQEHKLAHIQVVFDMQVAGMPTDSLRRPFPLLRRLLQIPLPAVHLLRQRNLARTAMELQRMQGALRSLAAGGIASRSQEDHTPRTCLGHSSSVAACTFLAAAVAAVAAGNFYLATACQR
jgi:hypothetical protein